MTTKRFTVPENYRCIQDNLTKEHYLCEDKTEAINLAYLLNGLSEENERLKKIQNSFEVNWTQNYVEFDKDELYIKDNNTEIRLNGTNLFIEVYIPQINEYYRFQYKVTGRSLMMKFIENYNSNGDNE